MPPADNVQRVRIYLSRDDRWEGGPLFLAILERLRRSGATGATALQGLAGFGPGQRSRPGTLDRPDQHQPVVVEWVDRTERVARLLPLLDELVGDALITVEDVPVYRALLRARGPFAADRSVGDVMRHTPPTAATSAPLSEVLALLQAERLGVLPITDDDGRLAGLIGPDDLAWRAGLRLAPGLIDLLSPAERNAALAPLAGRAAHEVMSAEPRSVSPTSTLPQALVTMIEWGYPELPVVDRDGRLVGLLGQDDVLRAAVEQATAESGPVRDAEPPATVGLIMQAATHQVAATRPLNQALAQLLATPGQRLLVVDGAGRLVGALDLAATLEGLTADERAGLLDALQRPQPPPAAALPGADRSLEGLLLHDVPTIGPEAAALGAARRLLELGIAQLAVVDPDRRLLGIIARGGLVRALMQQSE